jgi:hypothetical protein
MKAIGGRPQWLRYNRARVRRHEARAPRCCAARESVMKNPDATVHEAATDLVRSARRCGAKAGKGQQIAARQNWCVYSPRDRG